MGAMQRSLPPRVSPHLAAFFARPVGRERERRLGLHSGLQFQRADRQVTFLRPWRGGLRTSGWRPVSPGPASLPCSGLVRHPVTICWVGFDQPRADRRSSLAPAPWRG
jgi:hypothetical protein